MIIRVKSPRYLPSRLLARYLNLALVFAIAISIYYVWISAFSWDIPAFRLPRSFEHPIQTLMKEASRNHQSLLKQQPDDVFVAATRYRKRRGRHPPPGFDQWFKAATDRNALVIESFFDRIHKDIEPFWALEPSVIKHRANSWPFAVKVRRGRAYPDGDVEGRVPWLQLWTALVKEFSHYLPDVDMPINMMDESRIVVPFDRINKYMADAEQNRTMPDASVVGEAFVGLDAVDEMDAEPYKPEWQGVDNKYWNIAVKGCAPDTPAHGVPAVQDYSPPADFPSHFEPPYSYLGYVRNWTEAINPCLQPHLRELHGTFVEPISLSTTEELIPLFGGSKLPLNNEIIIPGAMYLTGDDHYSGGDDHGPPWEEKTEGVIWRGDGSGGRPHVETWHRFHRHRLIDMLNSTTVARAEQSPEGRTRTFRLTDTSIYKSPGTSRRTMSKWLRQHADAAFVHFCGQDECGWLHDYYRVVDPVPMREQYRYKFLPDADGNSFSARFRGFMLSTSAPLKASIYTEWHDDRLTPWLHFIPLDNTFQDLHPVLEFFIDQKGPGDAAARTIAEAGKEWAEKTLRREDMALYVWRLLLEWARVCDENRDRLGYVKDLADQDI